MDAFYVSVSLLQRPELVGQPVLVGGAGNRGVVLSASYEARALGVHSAMPMSRARRLAPTAVIIAPDYAAYSATSRAVMEVFRSVTDAVEPVSADEAFLDVSMAMRRLGRPTGIADMIRAQVHDEQGVTCSVGIAADKFIAKMASSRCKPDGMLLVPSESIVAFLHPMPVGALWGVGEKTEERLHRLGLLRTVADVAATPVPTLVRAFGPALGKHLHQLSWGRDQRGVVPATREHSIGADETFRTDVDDHQLPAPSCSAVRQGGRAHAAGGHGGPNRAAEGPVRRLHHHHPLQDAARRDGCGPGSDRTTAGLYDGLGLQRVRLRLVGVRMEHLVDRADSAQVLLDAPEHGWRDAEAALDRVRDRYGPAAVQPARLISKASPGGGSELP